MAITTMSMVLTVYVLNLYGISDRPVPPWARTIVTGYLARLVCMCRRVDGVRRDHQASSSGLYGSSLLGPRSDFSLGSSATGSGGVHTLRIGPQDPEKTAAEAKQREIGWAKEWQRLAEVVDRLFFWIFLFGIVFTTLILFHPLVRSNDAGDHSLDGDNN